MSNSQHPTARAAAAAATNQGEARETQGQNSRFTPLRSYVTRAQALTREARSELALSRLIPAPRL